MIEEFGAYYGISVVIFIYLWLKHPSDNHHPLILVLNIHFWKWWMPFNGIWYLISEDLALIPITIFGSLGCMALAHIIAAFIVSSDKDK
jgi:phage shock protein PspC (stress-responsive transcriptional regulator)